MLIGSPTPAGAPALFWPAALVLWGPGSASALHAHHAIQLVLALRGKLRVRTQRRGRWARRDAILVQPDAPHEVDATGSAVLIAFIDPESDPGAHLLLSGAASPVRALGAETVLRWRAQLGPPPALDARRVEEWLVGELLPGRAQPRLHPRVKRVLAYLRENLAQLEEVSLEQVAAVAGLSPSRFLHALRTSLGTPLRPYVLWLRVQHAAMALSRGATATEAAHVAGFADAAHLTRTFRRMLGVTPAAVARASRTARTYGMSGS